MPKLLPLTPKNISDCIDGEFIFFRYRFETERGIVLSDPVDDKRRILILSRHGPVPFPVHEEGLASTVFSLGCGWNLLPDMPSLISSQFERDLENVPGALYFDGGAWGVTTGHTTEGRTPIRVKVDGADAAVSAMPPMFFAKWSAIYDHASERIDLFEVDIRRNS